MAPRLLGMVYSWLLGLYKYRESRQLAPSCADNCTGSFLSSVYERRRLACL